MMKESEALDGSSGKATQGRFDGPAEAADRQGTSESKDNTGNRQEDVNIQQGKESSGIEPKPEVPYVNADKYFSYKPTPGTGDGKFINRMEVAAGVCHRHCADADLGANIHGSWLLTEIDHWDCEHERIVLLTEKALIICNYHFIMNKVESYKHAMLDVIDTVVAGDFQYPGTSVMPKRQHGGVQIRWNNGVNPSFSQRWNPFCKDIPYATFKNHPVFYQPSQQETVIYSVDNLFETVVPVINKNTGRQVTVVKEPIVIHSYASVGSLVFNQSSLGFFMDRNGICY